MQDTLREVYDRFDPEGAPHEAGWIADRKLSPAHDIGQRIRLDLGEGRFLLVGTVGSGKSTELVRIATALAGNRFVVSLDLVAHFTRVVADAGALQSVRAWEVVFLAALAIARAATERLELELPEGALADLGAAWERAARKSGVPDVDASVDLAKLAKSMVILASSIGGGAAGGAAALTTLAALESVDAKWKLPIGRAPKSLEDQTDEIQSLVQAANVIVGAVQHAIGHGILLVLDGLDRVEDRDAARALFGDSAILSKLSCNAVVTGPFVLRHDISLASVRGFDVRVLVNEPVLDQHDPLNKRGPGVDFLCDLFARRTRDLPAFVGADIIAELAHASGGRLRDFVKLVREAAAQSILGSSAVIEPSHVRDALRAQRLLLETGLTTDHLGILRGVMADPGHRLPSGDAVGDLLRTSKLLPYPDGSEWYYPHALLFRGQLLA